MNPQRRQLLKLGLLGTVLSPVGELPAALPADTLRVAEIADREALPRFAPGDWLLADTGIDRYQGDGLYLYPAWGQPRAYLVSRRDEPGHGPMLRFHNPGTGQLLWSQNLDDEARFAARISGHLRAGELPPEAGRTRFSPLRIPALPRRG